MMFRSFLILIFALGMQAIAGDHTCKERKGGDDGIYVHGHWTIKVLNPDGTLDQELEFDNALVGASLFTSFLNSDVVPGGMYIELSDNNTNTLPCGSSCSIIPQGLSAGITPDSTDITFSFSGGNFETLRIAGNLTMPANGTIDTVATWHCICGTTKTVAQCKAAPDSCAVVTRKALGSAVVLTAGQIVQITVDITFS